MKRNGNVEILRFIFAICIVLHHSMIDGILAMPGGFLSVEFFYMLSGYFLAKTCQNKKIKSDGNIVSTTKLIEMDIKYLLKRILSIYPDLILATFIAWIGMIYVFRLDVLNTTYLRYLLNDFLFLQSFGMPVASVTGVIWYLSSMFLAIIIIYPILYRYFDCYCGLIAPVAGIAIIGMLIHLYQTLNVPAEYIYNIVNTGNLRAFAMISLGTTIYIIAHRIEGKIFLIKIE